jgi:hypothetical protein
MVVNICCSQAVLPGDEFPAVEIPECRRVLSVACRETLRYMYMNCDSYFNICTVHLYYLYNEPTNAQLINILLYCCILHCPYMFRRCCITNTAFTYLYNLAGTDYELTEDGEIASKHVGPV